MTTSPGTERSVLWTPQPKQAAFLRRGEYEGLYGGAAGGGKSEALVMEALRQVHIPHYKGLILRKTFPELEELIENSLRYYPAAQRIHHAERGGLLHHTTGMLRTARAVVGVYPWLNADLLYAGVILHDLCKTEEMISDNLGVVRDYSREGLLLGHLVLGVTRIQEAANDLGISGEPVLLLEHMLLSHHGEAEYGSPRKPMFPEAEVLHWVDLLDARMNEMSSAIAKVKPGVFSDKIWSLDRRLYHADYDALTPGEDKG